ncbi:MAG: autotransporter outer membrane beta-barrel domain-containing protein [Xanthobacteraceae bacterium]|nr:autotransporter outer membrane beta-barrel domain-containing protein [Xanthobacteraceae bacterium]
MMNAFLFQMLNPYSGAPGDNPGSLGYARAFAGTDRPLPKEAAEAYAAVTPRDRQQAAFDERWSVWGQGFGGTNKTQGDAAVIGPHDTSSRIWGFASGADHRLTRETTVGFALAGGETSWRLSQGIGSGRSDVFEAGVYAAFRNGRVRVGRAGLCVERHHNRPHADGRRHRQAARALPGAQHRRPRGDGLPLR